MRPSTNRWALCYLAVGLFGCPGGEPAVGDLPDAADLVLDIGAAETAGPSTCAPDIDPASTSGLSADWSGEPVKPGTVKVAQVVVSPTQGPVERQWLYFEQQGEQVRLVMLHNFSVEASPGLVLDIEGYGGPASEPTEAVIKKGNTPMFFLTRGTAPSGELITSDRSDLDPQIFVRELCQLQPRQDPLPPCFQCDCNGITRAVLEVSVGDHRALLMEGQTDLLGDYRVLVNRSARPWPIGCTSIRAETWSVAVIRNKWE